MQARAQDLDYTRHDGSLVQLLRLHMDLTLVCFSLEFLALHTAKAEQRLCTLILIKVTVQLSWLFATRSNVEVKYVDIKGILYTNLPVTDFPNNDLGLMHEKIDPC